MKEWRDLSRTGEVDCAERLLRSAGAEALRAQGWNAITGTTEAETSDHRKAIQEVSHLCDEIALRVMWGEANEDELIAFLGSKLSGLWAVYEPLWLHIRSNEGGDPLHQAGFQAFAERSFCKNAPVIEARRINWFLGQHRHSVGQERCWNPIWFVRSLGLKRGLDQWNAFREAHRKSSMR